MKKLVLLFIPILVISGNSLAQRNVTVFCGIKPIDYRGSSIQLFYRDESPAPDNFYTDIDLSAKTAFNLGVNYNNYSKNNKSYWDITLNMYIGKFFGIEGGGSIGYLIFTNSNKSIAFLPFISSGIGYYNKSLGTLENNTTYI